MTIYKLPFDESELIELERILRDFQKTDCQRFMYHKTRLMLRIAQSERVAEDTRKLFNATVHYDSTDDDLYIPDDNEDETGAEDV